VPESSNPETQAAIEQFRHALRSVEGRDVDPLTASWSEIESGVIKLLGGPFSPQEPSHRSVALLIAQVLAERLRRDLQAFWFPHNSALEGAALGFADALMVVSPLEITLQALGRSRLPLLEEITQKLRRTIDQARAQRVLGPRPLPPLGPADYRRLFDPGFVQLVCLDLERAKAAWESTPQAAARDLENALGRLPAGIPAEIRTSLRQQIVDPLRQLAGDKPVSAQADHAPRLVETLALLHGSTQATAFAPAALWQQVLFPLLHIGPAERFPPLEDNELEAFRQGADPVLLYVEVMPFQTPTADEDGVLGVFPPNTIEAIDACFEEVPAPHLVRVPCAPLEPLCAKLDTAAVRAAIIRFNAHLAAKAGQAGAAPSQSGGSAAEWDLLEAAMTLLEDLAQVVKAVGEGKGVLCLRQATEAEVVTEPPLHEVRRILQGPRIILA
jgi:hypothetical protein